MSFFFLIVPSRLMIVSLFRLYFSIHRLVKEDASYIQQGGNMIRPAYWASTSWHFPLHLSCHHQPFQILRTSSDNLPKIYQIICYYKQQNRSYRILCLVLLFWINSRKSYNTFWKENTIPVIFFIVFSVASSLLKQTKYFLLYFACAIFAVSISRSNLSLTFHKKYFSFMLHFSIQ